MYYFSRSHLSYQFNALGNACPDCRVLDEQHFRIADAEPGENLPPIHPNCKCAVSAYMDTTDFDEWLDTYPDHGMDYQDWLENREFTNGGDSGIIKSIDVDDYKAVAHGKNIAEEVSNVILDTMRQCERENGFVISEIQAKSIAPSNGRTPVLQIEPTKHGLLQLNLNTDVLSGKTLDEINSIFKGNERSVVNSLQEAVIHESGHAILISGKTLNEISQLYSELTDVHIEGISKMAFEDGTECLAELEVLRSKRKNVTQDAMDFYEKYMGRSYK